MERDPLAIPGDPGYKSGPDSDIEVITSHDEESEHEQINSNTVLKVELVPADSTYVKKITGTRGRRGRKKKEEVGNGVPTKVIDTGETRLKVQIIGKNGEVENDDSSETDNAEESVKPRPRGRPKGFRPEKTSKKSGGRPKKKKKYVENEFKRNPKSTHLSRKSRYEQLQEKKDEFLQQESVRKAKIKEKQQKYLERAKERYRQKKTIEDAKPEKREKLLLPFQKKLQRKICMLALKISNLDKSKSKDDLIQEMALEWKTDREKFWENYKKRWKEVAIRSVKPMTEERAEFLRKRGQQYDQLKQEHVMMMNRVSTRNRIKKENGVDSPGSSLTGGYQHGESFDGFGPEDDEEPSVINYAEYLDDNDFHAEEESFNETDNNDETFLLAMSQDEHTTQMFDDDQNEMFECNEPPMMDDYQTNIDEIPSYYDEEDPGEFQQDQIQDESEYIEQINGYS